MNLDDALAAATNVHDFKLLVQADGRRGTTMADLADKEGDEDPDGARREHREQLPARRIAPGGPTLHLVK